MRECSYQRGGASCVVVEGGGGGRKGARRATSRSPLCPSRQSSLLILAPSVCDDLDTLRIQFNLPNSVLDHFYTNHSMSPNDVAPPIAPQNPRPFLIAPEYTAVLIPWRFDSPPEPRTANPIAGGPEKRNAE